MEKTGAVKSPMNAQTRCWSPKQLRNRVIVFAAVCVAVVVLVWVGDAQPMGLRVTLPRTGKTIVITNEFALVSFFEQVKHLQQGGLAGSEALEFTAEHPKYRKLSGMLIRSDDGQMTVSFDSFAYGLDKCGIIRFSKENTEAIASLLKD
jgi:hypothetical protein